MSDKEVRSTLAKPAYHDAWIRIYRGKEHEAYFNYVFNLADRFYRDTRPGPVLDAGCGTGNHIRHLAQRGYEVCGIDYSVEAIETARAYLSELGGDHSVHVDMADILNLPYSDRQFTRVLCWGVLMHIPSVEQAISELCRVTAPKGRIVIGELNQSSLQIKLAGVIRKILRREVRGDYRATPAGIEAWDGPSGARIVARRANVNWLIDSFGRHGLICIGRYAGELTEIYAELSNPLLRGIIHAVNRFWYRWVRLPGPAASNILIFEKHFPP